MKCGGPLCHANEDMLRDLLKYKKIEVKTNTTIVKAIEGGFIVKSGDIEETVTADSTIVAIGYNSQRTLYDELKKEVADIHLLGDARQVQNIMYAIWDAYEVAKNI